MADAPKTPPKIEKTIGKTNYIVTSHFPSAGPTAEQIIGRLIRQNEESENG